MKINNAEIKLHIALLALQRIAYGKPFGSKILVATYCRRVLQELQRMGKKVDVVGDYQVDNDGYVSKVIAASYADDYDTCVTRGRPVDEDGCLLED